MADLVTSAQVTDRLGPNFNVDATQLASAIADASALIRAEAEGGLDAVDHTTPPDDVIVAVTVSAVRRALVNPDGFGSEMLNGYRFESAPNDGIFLTKSERRTIRRAAGILSAGTAKLEGYTPVPRYGDTSDDAWLQL